MYYGLSYLFTLFKLLILSAPFIFLGSLIKPIIPDFSFGTTAIIWVVSYVFGLFVVIIGSYDEDDTKKAQAYHILGKIVFLPMCVFTIGCILKFNVSPEKAELLRHNIPSPFIIGNITKIQFIFIFLQSVIAVKMVLKINLSKFLGRP